MNRRPGGLLAAVAVLAASVAGAAAETARERGAYLVDVLAACASCHTPRTGSGLGPALSGGNRYGPPQASVVAPNITPDAATGIGGWSDRQIVDAIRRGVRPDGTRIGPPMPQTAYRAMSNADAEAIVAYLRSVPPVVHAVPRSDRTTSPSLDRAPDRVAPVPQPASVSDTAVARGRYIAIALSHCTECHTPVPLGAPDVARHLDAGGRLFKTREGAVVAPGIRAVDLAGWSDEALAAVITRGIKPDGSRLRGPMPVGAYAGMRKPDLAALIAFLRSDQRL